ncbi:MAG: CsbD family protein [Solirubrobacterales bacterium]
MNADILRGKWNQMKGRAKKKWGKLTDDDLDRVEGSRDELVGMIQERYGKSKDAAEKEVDAWTEKP